VCVFFIALILLPYAYPVWILRTRIKDKKRAQMGQVTPALWGNKKAVKKIAIRDLGTSTTTAELLTHQMFLESRWDWPVENHVQKLILFGLLLPFRWVLAAMIENRIYLGGGTKGLRAANFMGWTMGLEPTTAGITIRSSTN
jgi:hypothetical protein